jgi:hypothetical protein
MKKSHLVAALFAVFTLNSHLRAELLISFGFDDLTSASISTTQYQTGNWLVYNAVFSGWTKSGFNATHAIQLSGAVHGGPGDYAIMIYGDNTLTQQTAFAANTLGQTYYVSYDIGPTVYSDPGQATQAGDTFLVSLLRTDNTVLTTNAVTPGAWSGVQTFNQAYFSYVGDGSGSLRINLQSGNTQTRFAGAINNMAFWDSVPTTPIPEPGTWAAMAIFAGGAAFAGWRRRKSAKIAA